ncbi:MAG: hypothetical protein EA370_03985 [Wenzhouxiangella sp.]|nr:MAG: hypothetical protein EA370_03985 [Wenzhouxiangella sp.]
MRNLLAATMFTGLLPFMAQAEPVDPNTPIFRVEVVLLAHANGQSDRRFMAELDDFSGLADPLRRARELAAEAAWLERQRDTEEDELDPDDPRQALQMIDALDALVAADLVAADDSEQDELADEGPVLPQTFLQLDELSPSMADAWRRLSDSAAFEPLGWRAWYQPLTRERLSPRVRLHDEDIIRTLWLHPERVVPSLPGEPMARTFDLGALLPELSYRLDGSLRLRQRQFMHVELDLVWREKLEPLFGPMDSDHLATGGYEVHRLVQSRTVRPDRLEYFDSALFGVLILIQRWQPAEAIDNGAG